MATLKDLAEELGHKLQKSQRLVGTAESCTGGGLAEKITEIPGSSGWFDRGFVTYSNAAKQEMLGVQANTLATQGAVSEATAREMAEGVIKNSHASLSVAITGIAGPQGGTPEKPVGTVCFAWSMAIPAINNTLAGITTISQQHQLTGDRNQVRQQSILIALQKLIELSITD